MRPGETSVNSESHSRSELTATLALRCRKTATSHARIPKEPLHGSTSALRRALGIFSTARQRCLSMSLARSCPGARLSRPRIGARATNGLLGQRSSRVSNFKRRRVGGGSAEFTSAEGGGACRPHQEGPRTQRLQTNRRSRSRVTLPAERASRAHAANTARRAAGTRASRWSRHAPTTRGTRACARATSWEARA